MALKSKFISKGQVTIPKEIRASLGIVSSGKVCFTDLGNDMALLSVCDKPASEIFGLLKDRPRTRQGSMTIEEMNAVIAEKRFEASCRGSAA